MFTEADHKTFILALCLLLRSSSRESDPRFYYNTRFLDTHGSHVVTAVTFGASIDQYAFGEQSSSYTAREFTVKACASLAKDVAVASVSVSACSSVSKEEINKVRGFRITSKNAQVVTDLQTSCNKVVVKLISG